LVLKHAYIWNNNNVNENVNDHIITDSWLYVFLVALNGEDNNSEEEIAEGTFDEGAPNFSINYPTDDADVFLPIQNLSADTATKLPELSWAQDAARIDDDQGQTGRWSDTGDDKPNRAAAKLLGPTRTQDNDIVDNDQGQTSRWSDDVDDKPDRGATKLTGPTRAQDAARLDDDQGQTSRWSEDVDDKPNHASAKLQGPTRAQDAARLDDDQSQTSRWSDDVDDKPNRSVVDKCNSSISDAEDEEYMDDVDMSDSEMDAVSKLPIYFPSLQGCRPVEQFHCLNAIAEGTFGKVYRALDRKTGLFLFHYSLLNVFI